MSFAVFNKTIPAYRRAPGTVVNGKFIHGTPTPILVRGSVQPTKGEDLKLLPEGRREEGAFTIYTRDSVVNGDVLTIRGDFYEVLTVLPWENNILPHNQVIAVKMQKDGEL